MEGEVRRKALLGQMERLAAARVNDAVKLAYLDPELEGFGAVDGLDLTALRGFKRAPNGTVELTLVDRLAVLERLFQIESDLAGTERLMAVMEDLE